MHTALTCGIGGDHVLLLLAQLVQMLLVVLQILLLVLGNTLVVLIEVADGFDHVLGGVDLLVHWLELGLEGFFGILNDLLDERMLGIEHQAIHVRHLAIEVHAGLEAGHVLHAAHILGLGDDNGLVVG